MMDEKWKKRKREKRILAVVCSIFGIALISLMVFGAVTLARKAADYVEDNKQTVSVDIRTGQEEEADDSDKKTQAQLNITKPTDKVDYSGVLDLSPVVEQVMPSIVAITSTMVTSGSQNDPFSDPFFGFFGDGGSMDREVVGSGSGIIFEINDKELLIVTNNHVVEGAKDIQITFIDKSIVSASIKGLDASSDLAVVSVKLDDLTEETRKEIKVAKLGDSDSMKVGQMALAIGNALGYGQSLTVGYISAKDRTVTVEGRTMQLLQTDAAINPGNSGGALINIDGEVIGINSAKLAETDVEGMGYSIPISAALPVMERLKNYKNIPEDERGYLGITCKDVSEEMNTLYHVPLGVYVDTITEDAPAGKAGILVGDIVVEVDGTAVKNFEEMRALLDQKKIGEKTAIKVMRYVNGEYEEKEMEVKLGAKPAQ